MQSVGHPSFCKDQKRKLLRHRHFCNEFAANNRPRDKEMTLFANPTFRVLDIILLWFVLSCMDSFRSIQYSECCTHSISRVKMNWIPSPTALYLSLYCKGCTWMILNGLSKQPWSKFISVDHICRLFISWIISDSLPLPPCSAQCTNRKDGHIYSVWQDINQLEPPP